MRISAKILSVVAASGLVLAVATPLVRAQQTQLSADARKCLEKIASASGKFAKKKLKAKQKCIEKDLKEPADCDQVDLTNDIAELVTKLNDAIFNKCDFLDPSNFGAGFMGFPGKCVDPTPLDTFTRSDIQDCMHDSHEAAVDALFDIEYGSTVGPLNDTDLLNCQKTIAKSGWKFLNAKLLAIQKCRNKLNKGQLFGFAPKNCATADSKTQANIAKAESKARAAILDKCTDGQVAMLDVCDPPATTELQAENCIIQTHGDAADDPAVTAADLIDYEYATQPVCGDNIINSLDEECDGTDDDDCVGNCGVSTGPFPCLCLDKPRERVIEHSNADLDNGWTGASHDSGIVEGGGYVADLYDCDNVSDFDCTVGPSCAGVPHPPCTTDAQCNFFGIGPCRHERTAVGPHCWLNVQQACDEDTDCSGLGNFCKKTFHGAPLPLSAGAVSVCVLNTFTENIVGTKNLLTGAGAIRLRQGSVTYLTGTTEQPCPVCGGFCGAPAGGDRRKCTTNADCTGVQDSPPCITELICSFGDNVDGECRPDPPFGGVAAFFGNTSIDCLPPLGSLITSPAGLDILFNPASTSSVSLAPSVQCANTSFDDKRCAGGTNNGKLCTAPTDCPLGTCSDQCFCPQTGGSLLQKPNDCANACVSTGLDDTSPCEIATEATDCPTGFCHPADCRLNGADTDSSGEGACTNSFSGHCSTTVIKACGADFECQSPSCTFCQPAETCVIENSQCFVNSGINRTGIPDPTNPVSAAIFCIPGTGTGSVDSTAGIPGPGALTQPATTVETGF